MTRRRTLFSQSRIWLALVITGVACNSLFDIEKPTHAVKTNALVCASTAECAVSSGEVCLFSACSSACTSDAECPIGKRCLRTNAGTACVAQAGTGCDSDQACPGGTVCKAATCYDSCMSRLDCVDGQVCADAVCKSVPRVDGAAGAAGSDAGAGAGGEVGSNGSAGAAATSGAGQSDSGAGGASTGGASGGTSGGGTSGGGTGGATTCTEPNLDCDSNPATICETDINSSKANCGACSLVCQDKQTSSNVCSNGHCAPICIAGYDDCDTIPSNGCETLTATDGANCGGCGVQCKTQNAGGTSCSGGTCVPVCNNGFAACSNPTAGCTTSLDTVAHCGSCANACGGGTPFCVSRACAARLDTAIVNANTQAASSTNGASLTIPHLLQTSAAANAYRMVVVGVTGFGSGAAALPTGVKYNGVDMTLAKAVLSGNQVAAAIYYVNSAALPASAGTYNVVVASSGNNSFNLVGNVLELSNVEQSTGSIDAVGGTGTGNSCAAHPLSDTVQVTTSGETIFSIAAVYGSAAGTGLNTSGQTITEQNTTSSLGTLAGYLVSSGTGARTVAWGLATCSSSAHALVSIKRTSTP